jgi:hypothetical protein
VGKLFVGALAIVVITAGVTAIAAGPHEPSSSNTERASAGSHPALTFGNGCQGLSTQQWGGYRILGPNGRIRLVWLDSGSRHPCGVTIEAGTLSLFTDDPDLVTADAHLWCKELPTKLDADQASLIDPKTGRRHRQGIVRFGRTYAQFEAIWQDRLNRTKSCSRASNIHER